MLVAAERQKLVLFVTLVATTRTIGAVSMFYICARETQANFCGDFNLFAMQPFPEVPLPT